MLAQARLEVSGPHQHTHTHAPVVVEQPGEGVLSRVVPGCAADQHDGPTLCQGAVGSAGGKGRGAGMTVCLRRGTDRHGAR